MRTTVATRARVASLLVLTLFAYVLVWRTGPASAQTPPPEVEYVYDELHRIVAVIDPAAGTAKYVYDAAGNVTSIVRLASTALSLLEFTPNTGPVGSNVRIFGTKFSTTPSQNTVKFGTKTATVVSATATQIVATVPANATTSKISVTTGGRTATSVDDFTVGVDQTPTITSLSNTVASPGSTVTLTGSKFDTTPANNRLTLNGTAARVMSATATSMDVQVPSFAASGKFTLGTVGGVASHASDFYVVPAPHQVSAVEHTSRTTLGATTHVALSGANKVALVIFDAVAGDRAYFRFANGTFTGCAAVTVFSPNLKSVVGANACNAGGDFDTRTLAATGTYTMLIVAPSAGAFDVSALNVPADTTGSMTIGGPAATITLTSPGQNGSLTFEGVAGQNVFINVPTNSFGCSSYMEIVKPSGWVWQSAWDCDDHYFDTAPLPETGTYTFRWDPAGAITGSVTIQIYSVPADSTASATVGGQPVSLSIPSVGQNGRVTFSGTQDQRISLYSFDNTLGCSSLFEILKPDGTQWQSAWDCDDHFFDVAALPATGTYTVRVDPAGALTGSVKVQLWDVPADVTGTLTIGDPKPLTISTPGQNAVYTFSGSQDAMVGLDITSNTFGCSSLAQILKPTGGVWQEAWDCDDRSFAPAALPETGTYTVRWNPDGRITGSASFELTTDSGQMSPLQQQAPTSPQSDPEPPVSAPQPTPTPSPSGSTPQPSPSQTSTPTPIPTSSDAQVQAAALITAATVEAPAPAEQTQEELAGYWVKNLGPIGPEEWTPDPKKNSWSTDRPASPFETVPLLYAPPGATALTGRILTLNGGPLAGVTLEVDEHKTTTDSLGRFLLTDLPYGHAELWIDGRSANTNSRSYGTYEVGVELVRGETTKLPYTVWMSRLDTKNAIQIPSPTTTKTTISSPQVPGLKVELQPGTTIWDEEWKVVTEVGITPIPVDRPPYPMPQENPFPIYYTVQPGGAYLSKGATVIYPNSGDQPPGTPVDFMYYEPEEGWEEYGQGTVTPDGQSVVPDTGATLYEFTGNSILYFLQAVLLELYDGLEQIVKLFADPVSPQTGLFHYEKTDLALEDTIPIALTRSYRQLDPVSRAFGIGASHPYEMFLRSSNPYQEADLVFHDGSNLHFTRISPGTLKEDAVLEASPTPTSFYKARMAWNGSGFTVTLRDGSFFRFGVKGALQAAGDRFGNQVSVIYVAGESGNIAKVRSPNGRWIDFTYDGATNRVKDITDNLGRKIEYTYDLSGRLSTVKDAQGGITTYTYDAENRMKTITDPRNIEYLENDYYTDGRVQRQTLPDGSTYEFAYTLNNGKVTQTDITDPRDTVHRVTFNAEGYLTSETAGVGTAQEQTTTYSRAPGTNFVSSVTDELSRRTDYTYDSLGNVASVTRLAGTSDAVTDEFTYESKFSQIKTATDPLNNTTEYFYRPNGSIEKVVDPVSHETNFDVYPDGQLKTVTDAKNKTTTYFYDRGDLNRVQDALGSSSSQFADVAGRVIATTDPLGSTSHTEYNVMNQVTKTINPLAGATRFEYDANGNLTKLYDPKNNLTQYTYDSYDRVATRTDPLLKTASFEYDSNSNLTKSTDRKGQVTRFTYDPLDRLTFVGFKETTGPVYESTIDYTLDDGNRVLEIDDSQAGVITRDYNDLDELESEVTPQETVSYTYDDAGRPDTMTVLGLPPVDYTFDDANRLTRVAKGTQIVDLAYDELNRRTSQTMPGGVTISYAYDDLSRTTGITYKDGTTTLGALNYSYDAASRRTKTTGTWARTGLPTAVSSMTYNAANRMITRGSTTLTYDDNGNLTNDSASTYNWNARGQLASTTGVATLNYSYDGLGRRTRKTVGGTTTTDYVYDGQQITAEKQSGSFSATLLNGLAVDEVFVRSGSEGLRNLLPDVQGSTVALSDGTTTIPTSYTYEAHGKTTTTGTANSNPYQYAGREADGPGFYYNRARYYSGTLGRFISEDPIGYAGGDSNLYAYVANSPTNATDPSGLCAAGAVVGAATAMARKKGFWGVVKGAVTGCLGDMALGGLAKAFGFGKRLASRTALDSSAKLYHYTSGNPDDILRYGLLRGPAERVWATPQGNLSPIQAHIELGLPGGRGYPQHLFEIDAEGLAKHLGHSIPGATRVTGNLHGGAGGGLEVVFWNDIPPWLLKQVR